MSKFNNYPNYEKLREDLLNLIEEYKKGHIKLNEIHWRASDLDDEYFYEDDPDWGKNNLNDLYSTVLFTLDFFSWLFPEDIPVIEDALNCKSENAAECLKKWENYWADKDPLERRKEGIKRGYWKE